MAVSLRKTRHSDAHLKILSGVSWLRATSCGVSMILTVFSVMSSEKDLRATFFIFLRCLEVLCSSLRRLQQLLDDVLKARLSAVFERVKSASSFWPPEIMLTRMSKKSGVFQWTGLLFTATARLNSPTWNQDGQTPPSELLSAPPAAYPISQRLPLILPRNTHRTRNPRRTTTPARVVKQPSTLPVSASASIERRAGSPRARERSATAMASDTSVTMRGTLKS